MCVDYNTSEEEVEIPKKRTKYGQSEVWNFFKKAANGKSAVCNKCGKTHQTNGNTTNMLGHLKRMHPTEAVEKKVESTILTFFNKKYDASSQKKGTGQRVDVFYKFRPSTILCSGKQGFSTFNKNS